jgi:hypothetical protein
MSDGCNQRLFAGLISALPARDIFLSFYQIFIRSPEHRRAD